MTVTVEKLYAEHPGHSEFVPNCGGCKFAQVESFAQRPGNDSRYKNLVLNIDGKSTKLTSYREALAALRLGGYTETHWNWEDRRYSGGRVNYGTQHFWVRHSFRNPATGQFATLTYDETRERR